jgi:adenylosuccinate synthase
MDYLRESPEHLDGSSWNDHHLCSVHHRTNSKKTMRATAVIGLGWGDESKGSIVDALSRKYNTKLVVRFSGGAQAAHHVVTTDGRTHCFSQFGSGTLAGAYTHLSRFMMIDPIALANEAEHLGEIGIPSSFNTLTVDPDAPIITPYHVVMNQLRELSRGDKRHGSCGRGIGELASDLARGELNVLTAWHLWLHASSSPALITVGRIRDRLVEEARSLPLERKDHEQLFTKLELHPSDWLGQVYSRTYAVQIAQTCDVLSRRIDSVIFEGSQGVLLDEKHGFQPHTTWSNVTFDNVMTLLQEVGEKNVHRIGVLRTFMTRHGAGPFPTEHVEFRNQLMDDHNTVSAWQGSMRAGYLDLVLAKYAITAVGGIDHLALTHMDKLVNPYTSPEKWPVATSYTHCNDLEITSVINYEDVDTTEGLIELLNDRLAPVGIVSWGATAADKVYLRRMGATDEDARERKEDVLQRIYHAHDRLWNP